jgi:nucleoid-associated protein YgaU
MLVRTNLKSGDSSYTVQEGDTLIKIARQFYGVNVTPEQVSLLYGVNDNVIGIDPC